MCLNPIKVITKSKKIYRNTQVKLYNYCNCGKCSECQQNYKSEWMYRTYFQAKNTISKGGYIIFDTLTYDENNVPYSKNVVKRDFEVDIPDNLNFRCFDYTDVTKFLKRLRKNIQIKYGSNRNVKYICCAEYGNDDRYTHRPHYHFIFYVTDSNIMPKDFSLMISDNWKLGRTDGVKYKGLSYFYNNRLFNDTKNGVFYSVGYISKYINKDSEYSKLVRDKVEEIEKLFDIVCDKNIDNEMLFDVKEDSEKLYVNKKIDMKCDYNDYLRKLRRMALRRHLNQFHKISKGYGESALNDIDYKDLYDTGMVTMTDSYVIKRRIKLPVYYYRKLFQSYDKIEKVWKFNALGVHYKSKSLERSVDSLERAYNKKLYNAVSITEMKIEDKRVKLLLSDEKRSELVNKIVDKLGNNTIYDYAYYNVVLKDRLLNDNKKVYNLCGLVENQFKTNTNYYEMQIYDNKDNRYAYKNVIDCGRYISIERFGKNNVISSIYDDKFKKYEEIDILFYKLNKDENLRKQIIYDYKCKMRKLFSFFGFCE